MRKESHMPEGTAARVSVCLFAFSFREGRAMLSSQIFRFHRVRETEAIRCKVSYALSQLRENVVGGAS